MPQCCFMMGKDKDERAGERVPCSIDATSQIQLSEGSFLHVCHEHLRVWATFNGMHTIPFMRKYKPEADVEVLE